MKLNWSSLNRQGLTSFPKDVVNFPPRSPLVEEEK